MRAVDIIRKKRDGHPLSSDEIAWMIAGLASGEVSDYQWSALLMAIYFRGMNDDETASLTMEMMRSGTIVDLSSVPGRKIDKHSTGGVGDKTSLILAPIAAAVGLRVPMVSGRGLGHTGGTLDKLESIPGFRVDLDLRRYQEVIRACGLVMIGQTAEIAPADKRLYALRDATSTVESIPLISASIMSKKLAEGIDGLVLDVKTGNGAFMERLDDARKLAETMCAIGRDLGKRMRALITRMDQPLGLAVGNALEVVECLNSLQGTGPGDLTGLSIELAAEMVLMGELASDLDEARELCERTIRDGSAFAKFQEMVELQGGDPRSLDDLSLLPTAKTRLDVPAERGGYVQRLDARPLGHATMLLGAGRARVESTIDPAVGIVLNKKVGDHVEEGEPLCTVHLNDPAGLNTILNMITSAYAIEDGKAAVPPLIVERL